MSYQPIPLDAFADTFGNTTGELRPFHRQPFLKIALLELSSVALGGKIVNVSDEFFAAACHLLLVEVSPRLLKTISNFRAMN